MTEASLDRLKTTGWLTGLILLGIAANTLGMMRHAGATEFDRHGAHPWQPRFTNEILGTYTKRAAKPKQAKRHARKAPRPQRTRHAAPQFIAGGGSGLVAEARRYLGSNPTGRSSLWCADFMNLVLERVGHKGTGSRLARSFASYGTRVSGPQVGAIAVMTRGRGGGHVGVVTGIDGQGNPIIISGNHNRRVAEATYSRARIYAYVVP
jgi:uncharacterized protein (TIGR02594 family)